MELTPMNTKRIRPNGSAAAAVPQSQNREITLTLSPALHASLEFFSSRAGIPIEAACEYQLFSDFHAPDCGEQGWHNLPESALVSEGARKLLAVDKSAQPDPEHTELRERPITLNLALLSEVWGGINDVRMAVLRMNGVLELASCYLTEARNGEPARKELDDMDETFDLLKFDVRCKLEETMRQLDEAYKKLDSSAVFLRKRTAEEGAQ